LQDGTSGGRRLVVVQELADAEPVELARSGTANANGVLVRR
jgi:hypothetical protein